MKIGLSGSSKENIWSRWDSRTFPADVKTLWAEMAVICDGIFEKVGKQRGRTAVYGYWQMINDLNSFYAYSKI